MASVGAPGSSSRAGCPNGKGNGTGGKGGSIGTSREEMADLLASRAFARAPRSLGSGGSRNTPHTDITQGLRIMLET
eukprot:6433880-Pyramimonas_sp.AAC.1